MKKNKFFFLIGLLLSLNGCLTSKYSSKATDKNLQGSFLPEELVGVWVADRKGWAFKIEKDGTINKLSHMLSGKVRVDEGGKTIEGPENTFATFVLGPVDLFYDNNTQTLTIKVEMAYYEIQLPYGRLIGRTEDIFSGKVDFENERWAVEWRSFGWLEGADEPNIEEINKNPDFLIFKKIILTSENQ